MRWKLAVVQAAAVCLHQGVIDTGLLG